MNTYIQSQVASNVSRDLIIIGLVTEHNLSLSKATDTVAKYYKDNGLSKVIVSHKDAALELLAIRYESDQWDHKAVADAVLDLQAEYGVAESTARDYTKAYSSEVLKVPHPKLDPRLAIFEWFRDVAPTLEGDMTHRKEVYMEYATKELGRSKSNANEYWKGYELHMFLSA